MDKNDLHFFDLITAKIIGHENLEQHSFESLEECCSYYFELVN